VAGDRRARRLSEGAGVAGARAAPGGGWAIALAAWALGVLAANGARADEFDSLSIVTASGVHAFKVEVAASEAARETGLMRRRYMPADRGMLFEFDREAPVSFWMKNTYIPLDMIFIARNGSVTRIAADAEPLSEALVPSGGPCAAVLELNGGTAARIGAKVGDRVRHRFFPP
jgi:uncharacterized membrane protein (UPF0127 family)